MKLRNVMFWKQSAASGPALAAGEALAMSGQALGHLAKPIGGVQRPAATVIPLARQAAEANSPFADAPATAPATPGRTSGLMNAPELEAFFQTNQFGYGRHHGSHYRTQEALDLGLLTVVTGFQNIVCDLAERRQARINKLQQSRQEVAALSPAMAETLSLACEQTQREIEVLTSQVVLAEQRKGWVLDALNRYQLGFDRGVREALDFDLLNA